MELNFKTLRALSSPTRIKILNQVLEKEATTTDISRSIDKTKSTVSDHLKKLQECGLVEKEEEEGRKRVIYRPTEKAKTVIKGKERKVKFSVASSVITGVAGIALAAGGFSSVRETLNMDLFASQQVEPQISVMSQAAEESANAMSMEPELVPLALGVTLLGVSAGTFLYGYLMKKLG